MYANDLRSLAGELEQEAFELKSGLFKRMDEVSHTAAYRASQLLVRLADRFEELDETLDHAADVDGDDMAVSHWVRRVRAIFQGLL